MGIITLKDIADQAGITRQTVGRILGGDAHKYKKDTVKRVNEIAEQLGFRPNLVAHGIRTGKTKMIGMMIQVGNDSYTADLMIGVHDELLEQKYLPVMLLASDKPGSTELDQIHRLIDHRVEGIILQPQASNISEQYLQEALNRNISLVTLNYQVQGSEAFDFSGTNDYLGGQIAANHFLEQQHRCFAFIGFLNEVEDLRRRAKGFSEELQKNNFSLYHSLKIPYNSQSFPELKEILQSDDCPTALFLGSDALAPLVYKTIFELGLKIPKDISIIGFGNTKYSESIYPPLTTLHQDAKEIGKKAVTFLIDRIKNNDNSKAKEFRYKPKLIIRSSTRSRE